MYVCVCNSVTESQLEQAVNEGLTTLEDLRDRLHVSRCCGVCEPAVDDCLQQALVRCLAPSPLALCAGD